MTTDLVTGNKNSLLAPNNFEHYYRIANMMSKSDMVPKSYKDKPQDILLAMEFGVSLGLAPLAAVQNIAVINGKPSLYGDSMLAIIQGNKEYEYIKETIEKDASGEKFAVCIIKRKGHDEHQSLFSVSDAKKANLWGKTGPWSQYPDRMLAMRARGFAIRNTFADSLCGVSMVEEVQDYKPINTPKQEKNEAAKDELLGLLNKDKETNDGREETSEREERETV